MTEDVVHPLDPLTEHDIRTSIEVLRNAGRLTPGARIARLAVEEPDKQLVRAHDDGDPTPIPRRTRVGVFDVESKQLCEAVVSVSEQTLESWTDRPGLAPGLLADERDAMTALIKADERWQAAVRERGVDNLEQVHFEFMAAPDHGTSGERVVRAVGFVERYPHDNYYAHPIDGLVILCDVTANRILEIEADDPAPPVPDEPGNFTPEDVGGVRGDLRALEITQPDGPSFTLDGHELRWQRWRMRVGFHPVEGLVLHRIGYEDAARVRPILYRAALSEMVVPYADPSISQWWRAVFDAGEVGLGAHTNSLELGCDCLGEIRYLDVVLADTSGQPRTIRNAICIHEEDFGLAWKHSGMFVATSEARRLRRLVVSFFATVGNYDYGFYWYFYPDGSLEAEVKLTGIIYTGAVADGVDPQHGGLVAPNLYGPNHQHLFCFRLDTEIDGERNTVEEVDVEPMPTGSDNPHGNAFRVVTTELRNERQAQRTSDPTRSRYWKIVNRERRNRMGGHVAYKLVPQYSPTLIADAAAYVSSAAAFASKHLWVTPYDSAQTHAAGDWPAFGDTGLASWAEADRPTVETDLVLWHVVGSTHLVRPEDWPVMPVERVGFALKPLGFFDRNPALDLPPPMDHCATPGSVGAPAHHEHLHPAEPTPQQDAPGRWSETGEGHR